MTLSFFGRGAAIALATLWVGAVPAAADAANAWAVQRSAADTAARWCSIDTALAEDRTVSVVLYGDGDFGLFFQSTAFRIPQNISGTMTLGFDSGGRYTWDVEYVHAQAFLAGPSRPEEAVAFLEAFRLGNRLVATFPRGEAWTMALAGTARRLMEFADCVATHLRPPAPQTEKHTYSIGADGARPGGPSPFD
ncbi:MAG: hypothetical protein ACFBSD_02360 [Paracoccaceae bacterium]